MKNIETKEELNFALSSILLKSALFLESLGKEGLNKKETENISLKFINELSKIKEKLNQNLDKFDLNENNNEYNNLEKKKNLYEQIQADNQKLKNKIIELENSQKTIANSDTLYEQFKSNYQKLHYDMQIEKEKKDAIKNKKEKLVKGIKTMEKRLDDEINFSLKS